MKKYRILVLAVAMVLGVALAALAQQQDARIQRWVRLRKAQQQAIETIQQHAAKLKAKMQEMVKNMPNWPQSDDQRDRPGARWRKWRKERLKFVDALESQLAILKGQRRLMAEHGGAIGELRAIRNLAKTEKAGKTVERLDKFIDKRQKKYEDTLRTLGFDQ
jgi:DNA repair exonuclease SbcCD ATPase subunit